MTENTEQIYTVLTRMGYTLQDFGKEFRTMPLYRESGNAMSVAIDKRTGEWYDFSAKIGGTLEYLVKLTLKLSNIEEAKQFYNSERVLSTPKEGPKITTPKTFNKGMLVKLTKDHSYWIDRGISLETIQTFDGGTTKNGRMANRYVFPIFDLKDNLVGFDGRWLYPNIPDKVPKWKIIGEKSYWVYPYKWNAHELIAKKEIILVESIGDMLSLWDVGVKNVLVTFGVELSNELLSFIVRLNPNKIILSFNNDVGNGNVGNESAEKARSKICAYFDLNQVEIRLPAKKDFNEMTPDERLDWYHNRVRKSESIVVNLNKKEAFDVYIGRSKEKAMHYGNPFDFMGGIGSVKVESREEAIQNYEEWLRGNPRWSKVEPQRREWILSNICSLEGKRLGCFCKPKACHGDILLTLLNENCK